MEAQTRKKSETKSPSNREQNALKSELIDQLLAQGGDDGDFFGPNGVFTKLKAAVMERLLQSELSTHLEGSPETGASPKNAQRL